MTIREAALEYLDAPPETARLVLNGLARVLVETGAVELRLARPAILEAARDIERKRALRKANKP